MSYYFDYIEGLCHELTQSWAIVQICEELDRRDNKTKELKRREEILVAAMSEIKATNEGKSEQPIADIIAGCIAELRAECC